jgi:uncharacterized protein involved in outer membrane biogenesis
MKLFKGLIFTILIFIFVIAAILLVIGATYENEVKNFMIKELNSNLKAKVIVDSKNIHFSLFKDFPFASLSFKNVIMLEAPISNGKSDKRESEKNQKQDTLCSIDNISLQFNILDVIRKKYSVKKISADNGKLKLRKGADGSRNWDVWKQNGDTTSTPNESAFMLEKFKLENISLNYFDFKNQTNISCIVHTGAMEGEFTSEKYELSIKGDLLVNHFSIDSANYLDNKPLDFDLKLKVDNEKNQYEFSNAQFSVSDLKILVRGKYISNLTSDYIDISLKGKDMDVQSVLSLLPEKYHNEISDYDSEGEFYFNSHIYGKKDDSHSPEVTADFGITKATITQLSSAITLKDVHAIGNYSTSKASSKYSLNLKTFSATLAHGEIAGSIRIDNFASPYVNASLHVNLLLEDVRRLLKVDTIWNYSIASLAGSVRAGMQYKGKLNKSGKYSKLDFENMVLSGDMALENAGLKIKNSTLSFDNINASFGLHDNSVTVNSFNGKTSRSDFYLKGVLKNILAYSFSDDADLNVDAIFQSNNFNLDEFLLNQEQSSKRDTVYNIHFSPRMNFVLSSDIGHLSFRKFEANNIRGVFQLRNQKLIADPFSFLTMDGSITASGMIDGTKDNSLLVTCNASLKKLNISKLFSAFEDFGQNTMTHHNLKGVGTAEIQFASVWKSNLTVDLNRIYMRTNLIIEKGELIKFEPIKALSKYIAMSELEDIKFPSMQNQIEIKDQKIFIPKMYIQSSALDLTLSGTHTFKNDIDYHVQILMSDILFQKARKAKKENNEFGVVEEDKSGKTSLFLSMTGTVDDPVFKYDKQGAKQNLKQNVAEEKHTLKQILKEEFGWFKKDTVLKKKNKSKDDGKFIIKWDEDKKDSGKKDDDF